MKKKITENDTAAGKARVDNHIIIESKIILSMAFKTKVLV